MRRSILFIGLLSIALSAGAAAQQSPDPRDAAPYQQDEGRNGDQNQQQEPPMTPEQQANLAAVARYQHGLEESLRASASPRDWALSATVMHSDERSDGPDGPLPSDASRGALLRKAAEAAPTDRLVQWLWAIAPAELSGCNAASPCVNRGNALAKLEPDNGAAWVPAIADAAQFRDAARMDDALAHMAAATRYDEAFRDARSAWLDAFRRFPMPPELLRSPDGKTGDATLAAESGAMSQLTYALAPYDELVQACQSGAHVEVPLARRANCANAGRLMLDQSTTITARMVGMTILEMSGALTAEDQARVRAVQWQLEQHMRLMPKGESDLPRMRDEMDRLAASDSEVAAMQEDLRRAHVALTPPAGWQPRQEPGQQDPRDEPRPDSEPAPDHRPR
jgi:hypothetical protein